MFFAFPIYVVEHVRQLSLLLNTIVLIAALVVVELVYAERPKSDRVHLRYFYPLLLVLTGLLIYAAYLQGSSK